MFVRMHSTLAIMLLHFQVRFFFHSSLPTPSYQLIMSLFSKYPDEIRWRMEKREVYKWVQKWKHEAIPGQIMSLHQAQCTISNNPHTEVEKIESAQDTENQPEVTVSLLRSSQRSSQQSYDAEHADFGHNQVDRCEYDGLQQCLRRTSNEQDHTSFSSDDTNIVTDALLSEIQQCPVQRLAAPSSTPTSLTAAAHTMFPPKKSNTIDTSFTEKEMGLCSGKDSCSINDAKVQCMFAVSPLKRRRMWDRSAMDVSTETLLLHENIKEEQSEIIHAENIFTQSPLARRKKNLVKYAMDK